MTLANPCLNLAIARLSSVGQEHFAIWVLKSPYPGGYVHHDSLWSSGLTQKWLAWQEIFSPETTPHLPVLHQTPPSSPLSIDTNNTTPNMGYSGRLMQELGISLYSWLFDGTIDNTFAQSQGIAIGQNKPLRLRLDIRDPNLIFLPWEIMQAEAGKQAISLQSQILFSRTTSDVDPLPPQTSQDSLNILLVLGQDQKTVKELHGGKVLALESEAHLLTRVIQQDSLLDIDRTKFPVPARVHTLIQPSPETLIQTLDNGSYNLFFYAGHGVPAPDGGSLFLSPSRSINGTELAQVLVRNQVTLAVFNACFGALPDQQGSQTIARSSLAEVLIHHGVPAVLAMRDSISDQEALSFIQVFSKALCERQPIDQAVSIGRQQLLTLYRFNQPAWTLPILYMHPDFNGELVKAIHEGITELPTIQPTRTKTNFPTAYLRSIEDTKKEQRIQGGLMRIGRRRENDLVIEERWVSQKHAEIICREISPDQDVQPCYFLRDFSRFGTLVLDDHIWKKVHHQEILLTSGMQIKFGSTYGESWEFLLG